MELTELKPERRTLEQVERPRTTAPPTTLQEITLITSLPETTSLGANLFENTTPILPEKYVGIEIQSTKEESHFTQAYLNGEIEYEDLQRELNELLTLVDSEPGQRRKRRQVVIATVAATAIIAGIASEIEYLIHRKDTKKRIAHDEFLSEQFAKETSKDLENLEILIEEDHNSINNALKRECDTNDVISNEIFISRIQEQFEEFRAKINEEIINLRSVGSYRNTKAINSIIRMCVLQNGTKFQKACNDYYEIFGVKTRQYIPKTDELNHLSLTLEIHYANPN